VRLLQGVFTVFTTRNGLAGDHIHAFSQSRDNTVWIATGTGLSCFRNGTFRNFTTRQGLMSDDVTALTQDTAGFAWVATTKGLHRLREGKVEAFTSTNILAESRRRRWFVTAGTMEALTAPNRPPNDSVHSLCLDKGHRLWIGSDYGMVWYNTGNFYTYSTLYGLSDSFVSTIYEDSQRNLWVGTHSGLNRFVDGQFQPELNSHGLFYDQVNTVFEDNRGNIWVGSREGLIRLPDDGWHIRARD
jgi:ligand-binding sensor domain-containing protein